MKETLLAISLLLIAQVGAWFQQFAQVKYPWFKENVWFNAVFLGVPLSYLFIYGARFAYSSMGTAWSARLLQFSLGILVMLFLSYVILGERINDEKCCYHYGSFILYRFNSDIMEIT